MKKTILAAALLIPTTSFAGGSVGMNLNSYTHLDTMYSTFYTSVEVGLEYEGFRLNADMGRIDDHQITKVSASYGEDLFIGAGMVNGEHPYATVGYHKTIDRFYIKPQIEVGDTWISKVGVGIEF